MATNTARGFSVIHLILLIEMTHDLHSVLYILSFVSLALNLCTEKDMHKGNCKQINSIFIRTIYNIN